MKNLLRFLLFVVLVSLGISLLYDYRMKHGGLTTPRRTPEKYSLASSPTVNAKDVASLEALNRERRVLVNSVVPSVVAVKATKRVRRQYMDPFEFFFGGRGGQFRTPQEEALVNSLGSGVIVTKEGHIVTNNHVVQQVDEVEVQLSDGQTKKARLIGADEQVDIAVLKIDNPGVKPLPLADSDQVQAGDFVLAIGNPFGFEETVTDGIISSKTRPSRTDPFGEWLQTNAAINPGNSGGPLINLSGEIVGINVAIISASGGSQGIGFAIPSNTVRTALESLLKEGRIIRGYLGIQGRIDRENPSGTTKEGVVVDDVVPGSPAADAHIQKGDIIRRFDGREVKSFPQLRSLVAQTEVNKPIELEIERNGKPMRISTQLREQPPDYQTARVMPRSGQPNVPGPAQPQPNAPRNEEEGNALQSLKVSELTPETARQLDLPAGVRGVVVTASETPEVQRGDVIEEIDQQPVNSVDEFNKIVSNLDSGAHVLSVCRHRVRSFVVIRPQ